MSRESAWDAIEEGEHGHEGKRIGIVPQAVNIHCSPRNKFNEARKYYTVSKIPRHRMALHNTYNHETIL